MKLKVVSWNIWCDGHMDEIAAFLDAANADIVCLQEVLPNDPTRNVMEHMSKKGYRYAFADAMKHDDGWSMGNAVFSKYEITRSAALMLSENEKRNAVRADIDVGGKMLSVFSVHLLHSHQKPSDIQLKQAGALLKAIPTTRSIVMGDFNATPESDAIKLMKSTLVDADSTNMPTWSMYPEGCEVCLPKSLDIRLDYLFTTKDIPASSFTVGYSKGSDHLPISVVIEV